MCPFSFINVVCEILKSICDLYKYMLYLSHGKAKGKREKRKKGVFPECQMPRHSGKAKLKKRKGPSPSASAPDTRGRVN
jgi:hypothetical protein